MIEIGPDNRCPVCGRFMKRTVDVGDALGRTRTTWECINPAVEHDWDEADR